MAEEAIRVSLVSVVGEQQIPLPDGLFTIGRSERCDLSVDSPMISKVHCVLSKYGDRVVVRDLESTNGTRVNGKTVKQAELRAAEVLSVGGVEFRVATEIGPVGEPAPAETSSRPISRTILLRARQVMDPSVRLTDLEWGQGVEVFPGCFLIGQIAGGAFGEVWKANRVGFGKIALKRIRLTDPVRNEERALRVMSGLRHRFLARVYGFKRKDDILAVAMELGDATLEDRYQQCVHEGLPGIPPRELLRYLRQVGEALDYLYFSCNLLHRDIKPSNLLLVGGSCKVCDFGLAKVLEHAVSMHSGVLTYEFAPPEFFDGKMVPSSDQFSLAATYCYLLTGQRPFAGNSPREIVMNHAMGRIQLDAIPEPQRPVLQRALARNPSDRFIGCSHFVIALRRAFRN